VYSQNYCHQLGETHILAENVIWMNHQVVAHFLPVIDTLSWLSLLFIPKACDGRFWQGLEEVCEKHRRNSYLQMSVRPPPSLRCVPVHDPEPADVCFEFHLQRSLIKCILEQTGASCCSNVMDVTLQEKTKIS